MTEILRVAARGDGMTADGRHAAFAAPGDTLADDGTVVPGPHHQVPPCRHFPACGGCQLQHLDDSAYADFVVDRIASALDGQGLAAPLRAPLVSPPQTRRRATLHADGKGGRITLGFTGPESHVIVDLAMCDILLPELFALVAPLRALMRRLKLRRRADIHLVLADQGPDILVSGIAAEGLDAAEAIIDFCQRHGVARFAIDDGVGPETRWEPDAATITLGGVPVALPPAAFLQATAEGEAALVAAMREAVAGAGTIADLFAGLGTFALAMAGQGLCGRGRTRRAVRAEGGCRARAQAGLPRTSRPVSSAADDCGARPLRRDHHRSAPRRRARTDPGAGRDQGAGDRLCVVQSGQLRARCEDPVRCRMDARLGPAGGAVPLVDPRGTGEPVCAVI